MREILKYLVKFYQKTISPLKPKCCRYYPSCSEFAISQLENNSIFKAIYFTISRILKCNQLFKGGFDYPIVTRDEKRAIIFKKIDVKYWEVPISKNRYKIIKNWEWKNKNESKYE